MALTHENKRQNPEDGKCGREDPPREVAGGVYLFTGAEKAAAYGEKHTARLAGFGISNITATSSQVNEASSRVDRAVLER